LGLPLCRGLDSAEAAEVFVAAVWAKLQAFEAPGPSFCPGGSEGGGRSLRDCLGSDCQIMVPPVSSSFAYDGPTLTPQPGCPLGLGQDSDCDFQDSAWWSNLLAEQRAPVLGSGAAASESFSRRFHVPNSPIGRLDRPGNFLHSPGDFGL
ncbi:unnamed protein product, partial [Polarella glacialis]